MKYRFLAGTLLLGLAATACAQGSIEASLRATQDSDSFSERLQVIGWKASSGLGVKAGTMQYSAPAWRTDGQLVAGTYDHSGDGLLLQLNAGVASLDGSTYGIGGLEYLQQVAKSTSLGLSAERSQVDSIKSIEGRVRYSHLALVGDHQFDPKLNVGFAAGWMRFSNDNTRRQLRTRWNHALHEVGGLHLFAKTRSYWNSNPYRPEYFSPEHLHEVSLGLSTRFAVANALVLSAQADLGRQSTEFSSQPIWSYSLGLASPRSSVLGWRVVLQGTNAATSSSSAESYRYTGLNAMLNVPF